MEEIDEAPQQCPLCSSPHITSTSYAVHEHPHCHKKPRARKDNSRRA